MKEEQLLNIQASRFIPCMHSAKYTTERDNIVWTKSASICFPLLVLVSLRVPNS